MLISDSYRAEIERLIEEIGALDRSFADYSYEVGEPNPAVDPTQDDVDASSAVVVALETRQNEMRERLPELADMRTTMGFYLGNMAGAANGAVGALRSGDDNGLAEAALADLQSLQERATDAQQTLTAYITEFTAAEQLLTQLLDHWRTALGKIEHDLQWQAYVADRFGVTDNPRKSAEPPEALAA